MTIKGTVTHILPTQSGMGAKGEWHKGGFVIETEGQHPKAIAFVCWGLSIMNEVRIDAIVEVEFSVESREYNGKWYTDCRASKVMGIGRSSGVEQKPKAKPKEKPQQEVRNEMFWSNETPGEMFGKIGESKGSSVDTTTDDLPF